MLRFERRQLTTNVVEGVKPYVHAFEARYGAVPPGYWQDEYVLGFLPVLIGLFATVISRGQIAPAERDVVVRDCIDSLSGGMAAQVMPDIARLKQERGADFTAAGQAAEKIVAFSTGQINLHDPVVAKAAALMRSQGGAPPNGPAAEFAAVAGVLVRMVFYDIVNQRLMANFELPPIDSRFQTVSQPGEQPAMQSPDQSPAQPAAQPAIQPPSQPNPQPNPQPKPADDAAIEFETPTEYVVKF